MAELDVYFRIEDQIFVWNGEKAKDNRRKHGVSFDRACEAFFDPGAIYLDAGTPEEARTAVIGYNAEDAILFVVHIERHDGIIRIISARPAELRERSFYEDGN
jgi:uncharacterized DUF497 family protein